MFDITKGTINWVPFDQASEHADNPLDLGDRNFARFLLHVNDPTMGTGVYLGRIVKYADEEVASAMIDGFTGDPVVVSHFAFINKP